MAKRLIDFLFDQIFDAEWKGRYGEKLTEWELKLVKLLGRDGKVLRNVYVPKNNGETSEMKKAHTGQLCCLTERRTNFITPLSRIKPT